MFNFSEPKELIKSLSLKPKENYLRLKKDGSDQRYFKIFLDDTECK